MIEFRMQHQFDLRLPANSVHVVPVVAVEGQWEVEGDVYPRKQYPLIPAFAITGRKSQGLMSNKVMPVGHLAIVERLLQQKADVNATAADDKDFTPGLSYVRLSRLQFIKVVMFETEFHEIISPNWSVALSNDRIAEGLLCAAPSRRRRLQRKSAAL